MLFVTLLAALALAQAAPAPSPPGDLVADVRTLSAASDNDARFDAVTALLKQQGAALHGRDLHARQAGGHRPGPDSGSALARPEHRGVDRRRRRADRGGRALRRQVDGRQDAQPRRGGQRGVERDAGARGGGAAARAARPAGHLRVVRPRRVGLDRLDEVSRSPRRRSHRGDAQLRHQRLRQHGAVRAAGGRRRPAAAAYHARNLRGRNHRLPAVRRDAAERRPSVRGAQDPDAVDGDPSGRGSAPDMAGAARQGRGSRAGIHPADPRDDSHAERRPGEARRQRHRARRAAWRSP